MGWLNREDSYLTAESGLGYALGIAGGSMMLLMPLYSLRKNLRVLQGFGALKHWFRLHMMMGIVGPLLVLFHANFRLGSFNSNITFLSMTLVVASGLAGRFIYTRIHHGLYGRKIRISEMRELIDKEKTNLEKFATLPREITAELELFEKKSLDPSHGFFASTWKFLVLPFIARMLYFRLSNRIANTISAQQANNNWSASDIRKIKRKFLDLFSMYLKDIVRAGRLSSYARVFSLWHVAHIPLFIMLVITGAVHVVAVHMY